MNNLKINLIIINFFLLFFINQKTIAESDYFIVLKVDNEIITNVDIIQEVNYLIALNNDLKQIDRKSLLNLAQNSLIKEKIKKNEIKKNTIYQVKNDVLENLVENYYKKLNLDNLTEFKNYLTSYNLELQNVKEKIKIEILWNRYIYLKYINLLNINKTELKKKIEQNKKNNTIKKYLLSEILFSLENKKNFQKKDNEIRKSIKQNGFKIAANIFSISSTSQFGGRIGIMKEEQLSQKILKEIKLLKIGETTKTIDVPNGFLILKLEDIIVEEVEKDSKKELENLIRFETNRQLNQFSIIYFNKLKLNTNISYE